MQEELPHSQVQDPSVPVNRPSFRVLFIFWCSHTAASQSRSDSVSEIELADKREEVLKHNSILMKGTYSDCNMQSKIDTKLINIYSISWVLYGIRELLEEEKDTSEFTGFDD